MASSLYLIVVLCVTSGLWFGAHADPNHDKDWVQFGNRLYRFYNTPMKWSEAEHYCTNLKANLASLPNTETYNFIREIIFKATGTSPGTWVGGTDASKEGYWLWSSGEKFAFINWGPKEPNNLGGLEDCMEINFRGKDYVNDAKCSLKKPFVCAKRRINH